MLERFGKTWIKYFQTKELENPEYGKREKEEDILFDETTLFDSRDTGETEFSSSPNEKPQYPFLNKNIKYSMDYYSKNR